MRLSRVRLARKEAERFLIRVKSLETRMGDTTFEEGVDHNIYDFPKEVGAIRRASMDLTRSLSEMRKS